MKKIVSIMLAAIMAVGLTACAQKPGTQGKSTEKETNTEGETSGDGKYELALITDVGTIDDKSFNQGS